jgi:hypothetical protein
LCNLSFLGDGPDRQLHPFVHRIEKVVIPAYGFLGEEGVELD